MAAELDFSFDRPVYGKELFGGSGQLARASWLARQIRDDDIYFMQDGTLSQLLFKEVLNSYVLGQYIAAIVLGYSLIERTLAGRFSFIGEIKIAAAKSEILLKKAAERGWLSGEEVQLLDELRKLRNPIVHFRDHLSRARPEVRAAVNGGTTQQVLEEDAQKIIEATIHVLSKTAL